MSNYVSLNAKYYKNSNAQGEIGHVQRVFAENTNQIKQFAKDNFGCGYSIYDKYKETFDRVEEIKGKKIQSNSNTFIDGVLSFSRDQMLEVMKLPNWKKDFSEHIEMYMQDVKEKTGLEPLGWEMHMDEGYLDPETGEYKMNYHAQLIFFNFDFKTNKAPLRDLQGRKGDSVWSNLQDLAAERFWDLGFTRGISKEITKQEHAEKDELIAQKQKKIEEMQENQLEMLKHMEAETDKIYQRVYELEQDIIKANNGFENFKKIKVLVETTKEHFVNEYNSQGSAIRQVTDFLEKTSPRFFGFLKKNAVEFLQFFKSDIPEVSITEVKEELTNYKQEMRKRFKYDV